MTRPEFFKRLASLPLLGFLAPAKASMVLVNEHGQRPPRGSCSKELHLAPEPLMVVFYHVTDYDAGHQVLDSWAHGHCPFEVGRIIRRQAGEAAQGATRLMIDVDQVFLDGHRVSYPGQEVQHLFLPPYSIQAKSDGDIIDGRWADPDPGSDIAGQVKWNGTRFVPIDQGQP